MNEEGRENRPHFLASLEREIPLFLSISILGNILLKDASVYLNVIMVASGFLGIYLLFRRWKDPALKLKPKIFLVGGSIWFLLIFFVRYLLGLN